jgi:hypothetical protein
MLQYARICLTKRHQYHKKQASLGVFTTYVSTIRTIGEHLAQPPQLSGFKIQFAYLAQIITTCLAPINMDGDGSWHSHLHERIK